MSSAVTQKSSPWHGGFQFLRDLGRIPHNSPAGGRFPAEELLDAAHAAPTHPQVDPNPVKVLLPTEMRKKRLSYNVGFWGLWDTQVSCSSLQKSYTYTSPCLLGGHICPVTIQSRTGTGDCQDCPVTFCQKEPWQGCACPFFPL